MVRLKHTDIRVLDDAFDMHGGYVLDFSDRTIAEFFEEEFGIDFDDPRYRANGTSKAKRLRTFLSIEDAYQFCRVTRALWKYRDTLTRYSENAAENKRIKDALFDLIGRVEGGGTVPRTDALFQFRPDETLEELITAIERDISVNKPAAALDRLHTYCQKKFAHLLAERKITCDKNDPLHSRAGKYVKVLQDERQIREISLRILKSSISIFEKFNDIRNNESFAHDNDLVDQAEARFIYDSVSAILRFIKTVDSARFEA